MQRDGLGQIIDAHAAQNAQRHARANARNFDQLAKRRPLGRAGKAVEQLRILAHDELRQQADTLANGRQVVKSAHWHLHFVADTSAVHQHLGRVLLQQGAGQFTYHCNPLLPVGSHSPELSTLILRHTFLPHNNTRLGNLCGPADSHLRTIEAALHILEQAGLKASVQDDGETAVVIGAQ